jgi:hypothetical protein
MSEMSRNDRIGTHSLGEGLDFACNLLASAIDREARLRPERAVTLLQAVTQRSRRRKRRPGAGELERSGRKDRPDIEYRREQFRAQLQWCASAIEKRRGSGW